MRILYVEDNEADVKLARRELEKNDAGFEIDLVSTCGEALERLKDGVRYDVALVDYRLPDGQGMSVLAEIRKRELPICVVILTAFGDEEIAVGALKAGADDYVVKSGKHYRELPNILLKNLEARRKTSMKNGGGFEILFASHDADSVKIVSEYFDEKAHHIRSEVVNSAADFKSKVFGETIPYDVLLIDYQLPGLDMPELMTELRLVRQLDIPVVFLADQGNQETAALAMKLGADDYILKAESYQFKLPALLENALKKRELRREQEALRQSEERYRIISSLISDYAYVFRVTEGGGLKLEWVSETFGKMFGRTPDEINPRGGFESRVYNQDLPVVREHFRKVRAGIFDVAEFRVAARSGELRWLRDSAKPVIESTSGRVTEIYGAAQDTTERKRRDEEIRRSEIRFKELADFLPQPVFEIDESRKISFANRACLDIFGVSAGERGAKPSLTDFIIPSERKRAAEEIERVFMGAPNEPGRFTAMGKDGYTFPALVSTSTILRDSRVVGLRGILVDLTEITAANEALVASENRYRFLFESLADGFFMMDENGRFMQVNEAGCEKLGYAREEIIGQPVAKILAPEMIGTTENRVEQVIRDKTVTFESVHMKKDGTRIPVEVRSKTVMFAGKPVILSTARDLTERKKAEEAIGERNRQLKILSRATVKINSVLNVEEILRTLVISGVELVGATAGTVGLLENGVLSFREYYRSGKFAPIDVHFAPGEGTPGSVVASKRSRISNDSQKDPLVNRELHENFGIYNLIDVPILSRDGDVLGAFAIHNRKGGADFTDDDIEMLEGLAASAAVALENAKLIADMTRAEATVRESEEKFRTLVETSLVGVYIIQDGRFVYVNPAMAKIYGYTERELLTMSSVLDVVVEEDRPLVGENIRKRVDREIESLKYDFSCLTKTGRKIRVEVLGSRTMFYGAPAVIGTLEDITERKLAEELLRRSEERYRTLFEESIDAIYVTTPAGKFVDINGAGIKLFGFESKEEMLALENVNMLYDNPLEREEVNRGLEADGFIRDKIITVKRRDGTRLTVQDTATVLRDSDGKVVAYRGILRDVTEKKKLEEQLLQSQKLESLGQLTSGIAHDFNNVLGGIIGFTELALAKIGDDHPVNNYLLRIYGLADRAAKITKQLLAFARRQILMPKSLDVNGLLSELLELLERVLGEQIELRFVPNPDLSTILADPSQVEQVILNLAVNAGDAMPHGGTLTIETNNVVLDEFYCKSHPNVKPGEYVQIAVSDTGAGIDASVLERIFEPFFTTKEIGKGTGLGLSVVHGIIRQHGGTINVYSEVGRGSTFKVYFPAVNKPVDKEISQGGSLKDLSKGEETILVVEDNDELREFMDTLLSESGYTVLTAREGEDGIRVFEQHVQAISLVISDIVMPKLSGKELKEAVDGLRPGQKFLFISGYTDTTVHHSFILDDKVEFLQKPFTAFELSDKVRKILDRKTD